MKDFEYIDVHTHLNDARFQEDCDEARLRMEEVRVHGIVVGTDQKMSEDAVGLARAHDSLHAIVGLHPTDTDEYYDEKVYRELLQMPKVVGVGETGLDYLHIKEHTQAEKEKQKVLFEKQLELAVETDKPLMIHCREAHHDLLPILEAKKKEYGEKLRGDVHFFTAGIPEAKRYLDMNFTLSFTGVVTFTHDYDEVVQYAPLSMILSETDAPYVAPVPHRGKRNEPAYVVEVVKKLAELRGEDLEVVKKALLENTQRVFNIS